MRLDVEIRPGSTERGPGQLVATFRFDAYLDDPRLPEVVVSSPLRYTEVEGPWRDEARAHIVTVLRQQASLEVTKIGAKFTRVQRRSLGYQLDALALEIEPRLDRAIAAAWKVKKPESNHV